MARKLKASPAKESKMYEKAKAPLMKKYGFYRTPSEDFSDDGTRFLCYEYKGLQLSYAYADDHYLSIRFDYVPDLSYQDYSLFPSYKLADEFNGSSTLDLDKLKQNAEACLADLARWQADKNVFRKAKQTEEEAFRKSMEDKHMPGIGNPRILDAVWKQAWEYGHSNGFSEVESFYIDLADLAREVMSPR